MALDKLDSLKKKQQQLKARIHMLESAQKAREKKRETRRKILIGAYYLNQAREQGSYEEIVKIMGGYLNRKSDRALFGLEPVETKQALEKAEETS